MNNQNYHKAYYQANKEKYKSYHETNREKILLRKKAYREDNKEKIKEYDKKYRELNRERLLNYKKLHHESNKERYKIWWKNFYENNKNKLFLKTSLRQNRMKQHQTPAWADMDAINTIYKQASRRSQIEGRLYHVDHIEPLNGKDRSGLHVESNLQIILATENLSKGNRPYAS